MYREFAAARRRLIDEENARITQAWHVVRIYAKALHSKKVPSLKGLLISAEPGGPQSRADMVAAIQTIRQQFGSSKGMKKRG